MAFKQGISGNPQGRPAGSKNRTTEDLRQRVEKFLSGDWQDFLNDFASLTAYQRMRTRVELLDFCLPKLRAIDMDVDMINRLSDDQAAAILTELKKAVLEQQYKGRIDGT